MLYKGKIIAWVFLSLTFVLFGSCVSIPKEAPELSVELGKRITAIQNANITLLHRFFDQKRAEIDRFVEKEWMPVFSNEIFTDKTVEKYWNQIVTENNLEDRLKFITNLGPKILKKLDEKRQEFTQPLNVLEKVIENEIRGKYSEATAINNTITSFLFSASKVVENRDRYLTMIGVTDEKISSVINETDTAVNELLIKTRNSQNYLDKIISLKDFAKTDKKEDKNAN
jgi:hypothetical protein